MSPLFYFSSNEHSRVQSESPQSVSSDEINTLLQQNISAFEQEEEVGEILNLDFLREEEDDIDQPPTMEMKYLNPWEKEILKNFLEPFSISCNLDEIDRYIRINEDITIDVKRGHITDLSVRDIPLNHFPEGYRNLPYLEGITLKNCNIKKIPSWIGELQNLYFLKLPDNGIKFIPTEITYLPKLRVLNLHNNNIRELPDNLGNLKELRSLRIKNNNLKTLPIGFGNLHRLGKVSAADNQIERLPEDFFNGGNLRSVKLQNNRLTDLPQGIRNFLGYEYLYLRGNPLKTIPESILDVEYMKFEFSVHIGPFSYYIPKGKSNRKFFEWFFSWNPSTLVEKIRHNQHNSLKRMCWHPDFLRNMYWIAERVSDIENEAKNRFEQVMHECIKRFQQNWDTLIIP